MAKSQSLQDTLSLLDTIQDNPSTDEAIAVLCRILSSKHPVAIAKAATLVHRNDLRQLIPDLVANFDRLLENAATKDPSCIAKKAIVEALYRLEYSAETIFLKGIRHIQMESVWGGKVDTASGLRGVSALGLVRMNYPDVMLKLADLLADSEAEARIAAVRAVGYTNDPQAVPLLRLKVQIGDPEPQVMSECFINLLQLAPESSINLVARFLDHSDEQVCEMAALALAESKQNKVFPILHHWLNRIHNPELHQICLLAIAMLRHDEALEFLLSLIIEGSYADAKNAIAALKLYQHDQILWEKVLDAVETRGKKDESQLLD